MEGNHALSPRRLLLAAQLCSAVAMLIGAVAMAGWLGDWLPLRSFGPEYIPMAPNTAMAFLLAGGSLLLAQARKPRLCVLGRWLALPVLVVAAVRIFEFVSGVTLRVDAWILEVSADRFGLVPVGKMAFPTAAGFLMGGSALWLHESGERRLTQAACAVLGVAVSFLGAMFALGYAYGKPLLYDGQVIPMALNTSLAFALLGAALLLATAARDVAVRRSAEEELRRTRQFLDSIVENIPNMVFVKDARDLRFVLFNRAGEQLLGHSRKDFLGKNDYDFFPREQADFFIAKDRETLLAGELVDIAEEPITTGAKGMRILHTRKLPLVDASGQPQYLLGISDDVTERKQIEQQLQELNHALSLRAAQLVAANSELEAFAYSVSHDLRAPLRHIVGFGSLLKKSMGEAMDGKGGQHLETMIESAERMGRLIDDLLAFSRSGRVELSTETVDLNALVEDVRRELHSELGDREVVWRVAPLPGVQGDRGLLYQVLINLIGNAMKFTRHRAPAEIEIGAASGPGSETVVYVRDNGSGFNMKYVDKLFGVFQRLHSNAEFEGTGIGLANVRRIVAKHGGRTWAEGSEDAGATFYFSLPRAHGGIAHEQPQAHPAG